MAGRTKIIVCLLLVFFGSSTAFSQDVYFVTLVKGSIKRSNAAHVKVGDKLLTTEKLIFPQKDSKLILLHPQKGRFVLNAGLSKPEPSGEYFVYLKNSLVPATETVKLSSRGDGDLEDFFTINSSVSRNILFIGETAISLDNTTYRVSNPKQDFFFIQYSPAGGKSVSNPVQIRHDSLIINRKDFSFNGTEPTDSTEVKMGFFHSTGNKKVTQVGSSFRPVFMSADECRTMMQTIKQNLGNNKDKVMAEAMAELYYNVGKPDKNVLSRIYDNL